MNFNLKYFFLMIKNCYFSELIVFFALFKRSKKELWFFSLYYIFTPIDTHIFYKRCVIGTFHDTDLLTNRTVNKILKF